MSIHWIQTYTGRQFFPLNPRAEDLDILDIAHSLSLQCRFNGHCRCFYSVAEHAVRVSRIVPPEHALWGLLHDAGEAYLTDLPRPVKDQLKTYRQLEENLLKIVANHYQMSWPLPASVDEADLKLLVTEARDLMVSPPNSWQIEIDPLPEPIVPWPAEQAKEIFLDQFRKLCPNHPVPMEVRRAGSSNEESEPRSW